MGGWTKHELHMLDEALEVRITIPRSDGSMHGPVILWHGVVDDNLYVRSARGVKAAWFSCALSSGVGALEGGGVAAVVHFQPTPPGTASEALDEILRQKYDAFGPSPVIALTQRKAKSATLLVTPSRSGDREQSDLTAPFESLGGQA